MGSSVAHRLGSLSCTDLSDAMDRVGIACQCAGIMPLDRSFSLVGQAWTLRYAPIGHEGGTVGDFIDDIEEGSVVVIDNGGRTDVTVWGDLLTATASRRKISGTVIDGICRDVDRALALGYPLFARGNWMRTGKDRVRLEATQEPVQIGGIRVRPGDWLRGDGDGIVVVPQVSLEAVLEVASEIHEAEEAIRAAVENGADLREARAQYNYHALQTRR
ncbi:RraA family protein [Sphingobium sp. EM0848]|uniref:RraA family protein n=1 Tax=Sphingobium sp. EM0848 TaxID=2743473 RepID=UPI00159C2F29